SIPQSNRYTKCLPSDLQKQLSKNNLRNKKTSTMLQHCKRCLAVTARNKATCSPSGATHWKERSSTPCDTG
ncbi:MAG TPA: hypothetical protein PKA09_24505, partial [Geminicoccus sp.]|nr:hypothetical protein [Geminicoccus sp.]